MYFFISVDQNGMAPQRISPEVTVKGCQKRCIFNPMDETDDDMLWNGSVRSECEEDEGTDCEDGDSDTDC